jgi:pyruvate-formate lyase-activating enzyme
VLQKEQILFSPQGWGPARNIVGFTGGDLTCRPEFYARCASAIKEKTQLWVLIETNGHGLTPSNLDLLSSAGVDSFWLDIKAYHETTHRWLTGASNQWILKLPEQIKERDFVLEVLSLFIPGVVEADQIASIAKVLAQVDVEIPFTILAFFPAYCLKDHRPPTSGEMVLAYELSKEAGLKNIRLGNLGVFARTEEDFKFLEERLGDMKTGGWMG